MALVTHGLEGCLNMYKVDLSKKICIVGVGGFAKEVLLYIKDIASDSIRIEDMVVFMEKDENMRDNFTADGITVIPQSSFNPLKFNVIVAIGDSHKRKQVIESLPLNTKYLTIIHPKAYIAGNVQIGEGSIITPGVIITTNVRIGRHANLNLNTTIGHDCVAHDFFTTAPAVNISGSCYFGECVYLGTNCAIRQGVKVCDNVTIGMGAMVIKNIKEPGVYVGMPAVKL